MISLYIYLFLKENENTFYNLYCESLHKEIYSTKSKVINRAFRLFADFLFFSRFSY